MKGGRIYALVVLLATISTLQCIPIEIIYTGDGCDCPKSLNYVVNVPPTPKPPSREQASRSPSEYGYKLDVPMQAKAKVTYTFDFTVQEPKTPSPIEQEKWDLFAKIDRVTAHKKDCIAEEGSTSSCSCHKCKAMRRYVSTPFREFHPNSLSRNQILPVSTLTWAAVIKPLDSKLRTAPFHIAHLKNRHRRDLSRLFLRNRKKHMKKQTIHKMKQYNKSLQGPALPDKTTVAQFSDRHRPFQHLRNFMTLPRLRSKRDIKGEYDLIEKERDQMDLTIPEIIQFMPETLDPNFKTGQCQFGDCVDRHESAQDESKTASEDIAGNTLTDLEKEVKTQGDDDEGTDSKEENRNDINSTLAKRNAADYGYSSPGYNYKAPPPTPNIVPPLHPYQPLGVPTSYRVPDFVPTSFPVPYVSQHPYQTPQSPVTHGQPIIPYSPVPPYTTPYQPFSPLYRPEYQIDRIIADIINQHSDFIEAGYHENGALVDPPSNQKYLNKSLFKTLIDGKWHRYVIDDYYGTPKYRRETLAGSTV